MPQKISTAEWYEKANKMDGCICPTCQTGKENLALYPDYCPHADSLVIEEPNKFCVEIGSGTGPSIKAQRFKCRHYQPLKEEARMENYKVPVIPPLKKKPRPSQLPEPLHDWEHRVYRLYSGETHTRGIQRVHQGQCDKIPHPRAAQKRR